MANRSEMEGSVVFQFRAAPVGVWHQWLTLPVKNALTVASTQPRSPGSVKTAGFARSFTSRGCVRGLRTRALIWPSITTITTSQFFHNSPILDSNPSPFGVNLNGRSKIA